jgi:HAD superfamily hydrolase (TIGR01490 family)
MVYFRAHDLRRWTHIAYMGYHYPLYILYKVGIITEDAFRKPWPAHLGWYLRGYSVEQTEQIWDWVINDYMNQYWRQDTCQVLSQHIQNGFLTLLVSGTPTQLLKHLAIKIGADHAIGTDLEVHDDRYTGRSSGPSCIGDNKVSLTQAYIKHHGIKIDYDTSYAYADSISDLHLLEMVGNPVATYPDEQLRTLAQERNWQIFPPDTGE